MRKLISKGEIIGGFIVPPDYVNARALAANTEESTTVPTGASLVRIKCTADFYCVIGATATVPGDTTDGSACELNPVGYVVYPGQVIHVIAAANAVITFSYYK
jgi:hypothetical protein